MIQTVRQSALPMNAIILSKDGKRIETITNPTITPTRKRHLRKCLIFWEILDVFSGFGLVASPSPVRISTVDIIGLQLSGILVSGIMAIKIENTMVRDSGYPLEFIMFPLISLVIPLPNMRIPAAAVRKFKKYLLKS